jgi:site-specific DNA-methyltransferase (adenine-specific)
MSKRDYNLVLADCRKAIKILADSSIDFIVTDPPYFIDGMGDDWNDSRLKTKTAKSGVIGGLPIGMKFDRAQGEKLQNFLEPLASHFIRVLKLGGFCVVFSQARLYHRTAMALDLAGFEIRDMLAWKYEGQAKAFSQSHFIKKDKSLTDKHKEALISRLEGWKTPQLKPQLEPMVLAQKPKEGTFVENWQEYGVGLMDTSQSLDGKFPGTVMEVSKHIRASETDEKIEHLTVKPVTLIAHLVKFFTQEGQTVFDPFTGSGSHGVAALENNRRFIGFELEKNYYDIAQKRLDKVCDKTEKLEDKDLFSFHIA